MYHGILIDQSFSDPLFCDSFKVFNKKKSGSWEIYGIEIKDTQLDTAITKIQQVMKPNQPWYAHLYNDEELIVVFKDKTFKVTPHASTWQTIIDYGVNLNIPKEQLDFWPNRLQDERHYFQNEV